MPDAALDSKDEIVREMKLALGTIVNGLEIWFERMMKLHNTVGFLLQREILMREMTQTSKQNFKRLQIPTRKM